MLLNLQCSTKENKEAIAGDYFTSNGVKIYYETSGNGPHLLLFHGNGGGLAGLKQQIDFFNKKYRVIAMDCRGRGKSEIGPDSLTYDLMMNDAVLLLNKLKIDSAYVFGYSDGGIIGLLLAMQHPAKVKKLAIFGANLRPDTFALFPRVVDGIASESKKAREMILTKDKTKDWKVIEQRYRLMQFQPNISPQVLKQIEAPVLVMSCDRDVVKEEHTLLIYKSLKNAHFAIYPGETHQMVKTNFEVINSGLDNFFTKPFLPDSVRFD